MTDRLTHEEEHSLFDDRTRSSARPQSATMGSGTDGRRAAMAGKPIGEVTARSSRGRDGAAVTATLRVPLTVGICTLSISIMHNGD